MVRTHRTLQAVSLRTIAALALVSFALAGCGRSAPAPVLYGDSIAAKSSPRNAPIAKPAATQKPKLKPKQAARDVSIRQLEPAVSRPVSPTTVRVREGDTIYGISRRHGVSLRALIDENSLSAPFTLVVGQLLVLPAKQFHTVEKGDTVYGVSRRYGVQVTELVSANSIAAPYAIAVGQRLMLPFATKPRPALIASARAAAKQVTAQTPEAPARAQRQKTATPRPGKTVPRLAVAAKSPQVVVPRAKVQAASVHSGEIGSRFNWPVRGSVISRFGPKAGGLHNDGINIAAKGGTPVHAAEAGVVAYAGNELRGFGNLVLVRHKGGWTTAYAHADELMVKRGDRVRRGQVLAKVGKTGGVDRYQLHFEIRRRGDAVDPLAYLAPGRKRG